MDNGSNSLAMLRLMAIYNGEPGRLNPVSHKHFKAFILWVGLSGEGAPDFMRQVPFCVLVLE